jgi:hypothetical protein
MVNRASGGNLQHAMGGIKGNRDTTSDDAYAGSLLFYTSQNGSQWTQALSLNSQQTAEFAGDAYLSGTKRLYFGDSDALGGSIHRNSTGQVDIYAGTTKVIQLTADNFTHETGNATFAGAVTATSFTGSGSSLTGFTDSQMPTTYDVEYLVVGGGAGGGGTHYYDDCSGGGAGGYRSSIAGNPSGGGRTEPEPALTVVVGHTYSVVIGAGGAVNTNGGNSSFGSIISLGGGTGGNHRSYGYPGGSGGGSNGPYISTDSIAGGFGYLGQGYDGGTKTNYPGGGGGGGAGQAGEGGSGTGKSGGDGVWSLVESGFNNYNPTAISQRVYRAGGGGAYGGGAGGNGGGGAGWSTASYPVGGTANTGGGAGGNKTSHAYSAVVSGGSGIVILKVPTSNYSGTTTGSPTVTTVAGFKIIKFTGDGTYTA